MITALPYKFTMSKKNEPNEVFYCSYGSSTPSIPVHKKKRRSHNSSFTSFRIYSPTRWANLLAYLKEKNENPNKQTKLNNNKYQAGSGNVDRSVPVIVHERQTERKLLQSVRIHLPVVNDHVMGRSHSTLMKVSVRGEEEIIPPVTASDCVVNHSSWRRIDRSIWLYLKIN